ncbi:hypothetical protein GQ53DRAFT_870947 [Thozetella sp. PMI_491]|nr:hypothetical protein GQ53DRAFT_870947 [Thozetella sp. PMI_491]
MADRVEQDRQEESPPPSHQPSTDSDHGPPVPPPVASSVIELPPEILRLIAHKVDRSDLRAMREAHRGMRDAADDWFCCEDLTWDDWWVRRAKNLVYSSFLLKRELPRARFAEALLLETDDPALDTPFDLFNSLVKEQIETSTRDDESIILGTFLRRAENLRGVTLYCNRLPADLLAAEERAVIAGALEKEQGNAFRDLCNRANWYVIPATIFRALSWAYSSALTPARIRLTLLDLDWRFFILSQPDVNHYLDCLSAVEHLSLSIDNRPDALVEDQGDGWFGLDAPSTSLHVLIAHADHLKTIRVHCTKMMDTDGFDHFWREEHWTWSIPDMGRLLEPGHRWQYLRTLDLRSIAFRKDDILGFLRLHRPTLKELYLKDIVLRDASWLVMLPELRSLVVPEYNHDAQQMEGLESAQIGGYICGRNEEEDRTEGFGDDDNEDSYLAHRWEFKDGDPLVTRLSQYLRGNDDRELKDDLLTAHIGFTVVTSPLLW